METDIVPLGERALRSILEHVVAVGDEAETTYLEIKSSLDLTKPVSVAKIAKFLLGAANRSPESAARYFRGYAVLVIGAQKREAQGVPRGAEAHELEDRLRPYLGPIFPSFEFGRISISDDREVLFIIAQPPMGGQNIFPCHKSFQGTDRRDNLDDGAVYVRGASNTRPARAGELLGLVERARSNNKSPITLEINLIGSVGRVIGISEVLETLYELEENSFVEKWKSDGVGSISTIVPPTVVDGLNFSSPAPPATQLKTWHREKDTYIARGRDHFLGVSLPGAGIQVVSLNRFIAKPHLIVTFHRCEAFGYRDVDSADYNSVVEPVFRPRLPFGSQIFPKDFRIADRDYPVDWSNLDDNVEIQLTPESFRPNLPWVSDCDDYVILSRDPKAQTVTATWTLTEDGSDSVVHGKFEVPTNDPVDASQLFTSRFLTQSP